MTTRKGNHLAGFILCVAALACRPMPQATTDGDATVRTALSHTLPSMNGSQLNVTVVEVAYEPGGSSPPHSHPCPVIGFVVAGTLRVQVQGQPEDTVRTGEGFYEDPNGVHLVSANGSDTEPVRFLAYFTCDREAPLSVAALSP